MSSEPGQVEDASVSIESSVGKVTAMVEAYLEYLKTSSKSPLSEVLKQFPLAKIPKEGPAPALSEAEIRAFRKKLVDSGIVPETTTTEEIGISDEEMVRLKSMSPDEQSEAIHTGIRNIAAKALGVAEDPSGVKFQRLRMDINNRTGERKATPISPVPQSSNPNK